MEIISALSEVERPKARAIANATGLFLLRNAMGILPTWTPHLLLIGLQGGALFKEIFNTILT
ncbi:MAG: hypothetical protein H6881_04885 [Rhodobiaceae bacterium]|nr:hypothetical protein [Rhodobiaceae bacterium]MCC0051197.1 hypothetical protein [Rhodobiaceae bacterium]